jgi:hypothetical protein
MVIMSNFGFPQYYDYSDAVTSCFTFHPQKGLTFVHQTRIAPFFDLSHLPIKNIVSCCYDNTYTVFYTLHHDNKKLSIYTDSIRGIVHYPLYFIPLTWENVSMVQYNNYIYVVVCFISHTTIYQLDMEHSLELVNTYNFSYRIQCSAYSPPHSFVAFINYTTEGRTSLYTLAEFSLPTVSLLRHLPSSFPYEIALPTYMAYFPPKNCFLMQMGDRLFTANLLLYELSMITPEGSMFVGDFIDLGTIMSDTYYKIQCYIKNISSYTLQDVKISLPLEKPNTWEGALWNNITLSPDDISYGHKQINLGNIPVGGSKQWFLSTLTPNQFPYNAKGTYISPLYVSTKRSDF